MYVLSMLLDAFYFLAFLHSVFQCIGISYIEQLIAFSLLEVCLELSNFVGFRLIIIGECTNILIGIYVCMTQTRFDNKTRVLPMQL